MRRSDTVLMARLEEIEDLLVPEIFTMLSEKDKLALEQEMRDVIAELLDLVPAAAAVPVPT